MRRNWDPVSRAVARLLAAAAEGIFRSTVYAFCGLLIPSVVAVIPVLAAAGVVGSAWSWRNPWSWVGIVMIAVPATVGLAHPVAGVFRRLIERWSTVRIDPGFQVVPEPVKLATGHWWNGESYERSRRDAVMDQRLRRVREPAFRREVTWAVVAGVVVAPISAVPFVALGVAMVALAQTDAVSIGLGVVVGVAGIVLAPWTWRIVLPLAQRWLAAPASPSTAAERTTRADLSAAHDAEIRRIERDLHDGAQARLVAVGLELASAEHLLHTDPERALDAIRAARTGTRASLNDLRELVRGVYPPVLIERGLVPAVRAFALDGPLEVSIDGPEELGLPSPIAAAFYFAVCEALANVAKHAAVPAASVKATRDQRSVEVVVRDEGAGGATLRPGGGLDGVRRRLEVFDASFDVDSSSGGPTTITMRIPCA